MSSSLAECSWIGQPEFVRSLDLSNGLASTQYTNWTKSIDLDKRAAMNSENKASEQQQKFSEWLDVREGEPFRAIVISLWWIALRLGEKSHCGCPPKQL
jgi:hypothetical protein